MEGYSVTEAASVLGVPTERVWELLARGVLSGAPDGESGMRVYLQPRPAPATVEPKGPNGNGGAHEPERELSPFRELLTEFRNLTERYGQALLALGEARGEVASLRSRVDLLEARMDLRLPIGQAQAAGWSSTPMPAPVERAAVPAGPVEPPVEPGPASEREASEEEERRARARGPRRATESFAEALARAQDPSPPELPGATDAAEALAALRQQPAEAADIGLPREAAGADPIPVAEGDEAIGEAAVEADVLELEAAAPDVIEPVAVEAVPEPVDIEPEPVDSAAEPTEGDLEPMADDAQPTFEPAEAPVPLLHAVGTEPRVESPGVAAAVDGESSAADVWAAPPAEPETAWEPQSPFESPAGPEPTPTVGPDSAAIEPLAEARPEPELDAQGQVPDDERPDAAAAAEEERGIRDVEPIAWDAARYTTDIEEPDWFAAEITDVADAAPVPVEPADEPARAAAPASPPAAVAEEPAPGASSESESYAEPATTPSESDATTPRGVGSDDETGADEMEVAPTGMQPTTVDAPAVGPRAFPGAQDLEDAIAALRAAGRSAEPPPDPERGFEPEPELEQLDVRRRLDSGLPPRSSFAPPATPVSAPRGPASRAYRRLRRIFPG